MNTLIIAAILLLFEAVILGAMGKVGLHTNNVTRNVFLGLAFVQLYVLHAFLDPFVLPDLHAYMTVYEVIDHLTNPFAVIHSDTGAIKMEMGWRLLNKVLSIIWDNPYFLIYTTSLVIVGGYMVTIKKYSPMIGLSVILFFCLIFIQSLFVLRQHLAMALCLLAIPSIVNRNQKLFLLLVFLAFSLHQTAIVFLPAYYLYKLTINKKFWIVFIAVIAIGTPVMKIVGTWVYANTWYGGYASNNVANATQLAIQLMTVLLYLYSVKGKVDDTNKVEKVFFMLALMSLLLTFWGMGLSGFGGRLCLYFMVADIFLIPFAIDRIPDQLQRLIITALTLVCFGALLYSKVDTPGMIRYHLLFL